MQEASINACARAFHPKTNSCYDTKPPNVMRANRDTEPPNLANYLARAVMRRSGLLGVSLHWALLLGVTLLLGATVGCYCWEEGLGFLGLVG